MQLYANHEEDERNNAAFLYVISQFPQVKLFQPSPEKAPWHFQAVIDGDTPQLINFWPHTLKGQRDGLRSVQGVEAISGIILGAIEDAKEKPFDLFED